jgi:hypothetical protein
VPAILVDGKGGQGDGSRQSGPATSRLAQSAGRSRRRCASALRK